MPVLVFNDFAQYAVGIQPAGWVLAGGSTAGVTLQVEADAGASGGKLLRLRYQGASGAGFGQVKAHWTAGPSTTAGQTVEIAGRARVVNTGGSAQNYTGLLRGQADREFIASLLAGSPTKVGIQKFQTGPYASADFTWAVGSWYEFRLRAEGSNTARLKVWDSGSAEPADWMVVASSGAITTDQGVVGLALQYPLNSAGTYVDLDWLGVATDGETAPTQPFPPPSAPAVDYPGDVAPQAVELSWEASVDEYAQPGDVLLYAGEYRIDEGAWTPLFAGSAATTYSWDASAHAGQTAEVRVRATSPDARTSGWGESGEFDVYGATVTGVELLCGDVWASAGPEPPAGQSV
ncbi:MAG TPA: hypothetical protein VFR37_05015, partial [Longimicrobium sp.]|nr:hypothetical protein [Longimicrobium sp.]